MKCIFCTPAKSHRIHQGANHFVEFHHRSGPTMGHQQGARQSFSALHVNKVNVEFIELGQKLRETVEIRLALAPLVFILPIST